MRKNDHVVLIIPGLGGDRVNRFNLLTLGWKRLGIERIVYPMHWYDRNTYQHNEEELIKTIKKLKTIYNKVSIVGCSAGGSVAFNIMAVAGDKIYKAVNNCGRLRMGKEKGFRSFENRTASSLKFAESVLAFSDREIELKPDQLNRMMVIRPTFGDELVPKDTCVLTGAINRELFLIEHGITIAYAMISYVVTDFLLK